MSWGKRRQDTRNTRGTSGSRTRGLAGAQGTHIRQQDTGRTRGLALRKRGRRTQGHRANKIGQIEEEKHWGKRRQDTGIS